MAAGKIKGQMAQVFLNHVCREHFEGYSAAAQRLGDNVLDLLEPIPTVLPRLGLHLPIRQLLLQRYRCRHYL